VKTLRGTSADDASSIRDEVKLARRVTHKNVARAFDIGEHEGVAFLTMEYVDGESLAELTRRAPVSFERAIAIAREVCDGLVAVHAAGVIHRDLKLENVLVDATGAVKLTDFGIAKVHDAPESTRLVGTPRYMAPELFAGAKATRASDVYALGDVLFELFTGQRGRWSTSADWPRDVPSFLRDVVAACHAQDPEARPSVASIESALERARPSAEPPTRRLLAPPATLSMGTLIGVLRLRCGGVEESHGAAVSVELARLLAHAASVRVRSTPIPRGGDAIRAGREHGLDAVVDGTISRAGARHALTLQLFSVADGFQVWARSFTAEEGSLLETLELAATDVVRALMTTRTPRPTPRMSPQVERLYLEARALEGGWLHADLSSVEAYRRALAISPDDPRIVAGYARTLALLADTEELLDAAREQASKAVVLAPDLGESHVALALVLFIVNDAVAAWRTAQRALAIAPSSAFAHSIIGSIASDLGMRSEARHRLQLASSIEPGPGPARVSLVREHALSGEWDACEELTRGVPLDWFGLLYRARVAVWRDDPALTARVHALAFPPQLSALHTALVDRSLAAAERAVQALPSLKGNRLRRNLDELAVELRARAGDDDGALRAMRDLAAQPDFFDVSWLEGSPMLARLRDRPEMRAVSETVRARALAIMREIQEG
jgi:serine/threonine-protein kinase